MVQDSPIHTSVYSLLPSIVTSRVPNMNILRRRIGTRSESLAISAQTPTSQQQRTRSASSSSVSSENSNATTLIASGNVTPSGIPNTSREYLYMSRVSEELGKDQTQSQETQVDTIDRATAAIGTALATTALNRLEADNTDPAGRAMYLDAVKYMMRALPNDLSTAERSVLEQSTRTSLTTSSQSNSSSTDSVSKGQPSTQAQRFVRSTSARITNILLSFLITLLTIGLPLLALLFTRLLEYERRHHLSERVVAKTRTLAGTTSTALVKAGQTRSGAYVLGMALCIVQSILEGANDGIKSATIAELGVLDVRRVAV